MESSSVEKQTVVGSKDLIDLVFSWSVNDIIDTYLYEDQVKKIPYIFSSPREYLNSFITPLIEETHADLLSSFTTLSHAFYSEIESFEPSEEYRPPKDLLYKIDLRKGVENENDTKGYEPEVGDFIAITTVRPTCVNDLDLPERSYLIAYVRKVKEQSDHFKLLIQLSKPTLVENNMEENRTKKTLFAVKLINMTTNIRIWNALNSDHNGANMGIIRNILQTEFYDAENCSICQSDRLCGAVYSDVRARIRSSDLNESQQDAVLSCIRTRECHHQNSVKMIWGPPGTGKTKTVGFLLNLLLKMKCRTVTCAPTNTAVVQVTKRLADKVTDSAEYDTYGLGDIVLFGNKKRMKIDDCDDLYDVFLDHRADMLVKCFTPKSGWKDTLLAMICLLKEPQKQYHFYLRKLKGKDIEKNDDDDAENNLVFKNEDIVRNEENSDTSDNIFKDKKSWKEWRQVVVQTLKENKKKNKPKHVLPVQKEKKSTEGEYDGNDLSTEEGTVQDNPLTFDEFVKKRFNCVGERLDFFIANLYTHLPTSVILLKVVKNMFAALDSLKSFQPLLNGIPNGELKEAYSRGSCYTNFNVARVNSLFLLESLLLDSKFDVPFLHSPNRRLIKEFCLEKAYLIFCTTSGSAKLHVIDMSTSLELLVIDEAAQLKECESAIPLQLPGIRHAILVGDERQLPAMVKSQISEEADFGRSLFERLAYLGHKKHLLNIQYRMHPSISLFPSREFYQNQILDGQNVKGRSYNRRFLRGKIYNSYSFINVSLGKEEFDDKRSRKNLVEVAVVSEIVASLHKEFILTKRKVRIGVISPYKAQVSAIAEKIGKYTTDSQNDFFVSIRTVDGFQGGEEDVIIISTVRNNGIGSVSFLSSHQRGNVALTRARYCLWIVGSGATLKNSCTFWKNLVIDATERGCFHKAEEDKNLAHAITVALVELNQVSILRNLDSLMFREARWKVCFTEAFWISVGRVKNSAFCRKVLCLLERLSSGWRQQHNENDHVVQNGTSSQLVEYYMVNMQLYLVWNVDIMKDDSHYFQVLKVWDILPQSNLPELSNQLDILYASYSMDKMSCCKYKFYDGNLVVPMRWPIESSCTEANPGQLLSKSAASLNLQHEQETSSTTNMNLVVPTTPADSSCKKDDMIELLSKSLASLSLKG